MILAHESGVNLAQCFNGLHMQTADDLFGTPNGSPRTDRLIEASLQWAEPED